MWFLHNASLWWIQALARKLADRSHSRVCIVQQQCGVPPARRVIRAQHRLDLPAQIRYSRYDIAERARWADRGAGTAAHAELGGHFNVIAFRRDGLGRADVDALRTAGFLVATVRTDIGAIVEVFGLREFAFQRRDLGDCLEPGQGIGSRRKVSLRRLMLREKRLVAEIENHIKLRATPHIHPRKINRLNRAAGSHTTAVRFALVEIDLIRKVNRVFRAGAHAGIAARAGIKINRIGLLPVNSERTQPALHRDVGTADDGVVTNA